MFPHNFSLHYWIFSVLLLYSMAVTEQMKNKAGNSADSRRYFMIVMNIINKKKKKRERKKKQKKKIAERDWRIASGASMYMYQIESRDEFRK